MRKFLCYSKYLTVLAAVSLCAGSAAVAADITWGGTYRFEGIKLIKDANGHHLTPLYDEINRANTIKLSHWVAANFDEALTALPEALQDVARIESLVDMLDFSRASFEKQVLVASSPRLHTFSKWPIEQEVERLRLGQATPRELSTL